VHLMKKGQDLRNQLSRKNVCSFSVDLCFLAQVADINIKGNMELYMSSMWNVIM